MPIAIWNFGLVDTEKTLFLKVENQVDRREKRRGEHNQIMLGDNVIPNKKLSSLPKPWQTTKPIHANTTSVKGRIKNY